MALQITIQAVDRTKEIKLRSLVKNEGLTKNPDDLEFAIIKTPTKTIPSLGDEVVVNEGGTKIFGGIITEKNDKIINGILIGYNIKCKDYTQVIDRKLVSKSYTNQDAHDIVLDIINTFTSGFTTVNVESTSPMISSVKFNYEPVSRAIQKICDMIGWDWYVDYDKDIHFFDYETIPSPFDINDTDGKLEWRTLNFERNILELKNSIIVRGGEYLNSISEGDAIDKYIADGTQISFPLAYRYSNVGISINGLAQTVGVDNITDPTTVNVLYNFQEKMVKWPEAGKPTNGDVVKIWGDAYIPLIARVRDQISINTYGEYQFLVVNKQVRSINEAFALGNAELKKWKTGAYSAQFKTTETGLKTGMIININSALMGVNQDFKINKIVGKIRTGTQMEYTVYLLASGEITFSDVMIGLLAKERDNISIDPNEVVQRLEAFYESVDVGETLAVTAKSSPYTWGLGGSNDFKWSLATWF